MTVSNANTPLSIKPLPLGPWRRWWGYMLRMIFVLTINYQMCSDTNTIEYWGEMIKIMINGETCWKRVTDRCVQYQGKTIEAMYICGMMLHVEDDMCNCIGDQWSNVLKTCVFDDGIDARLVQYRGWMRWKLVFLMLVQYRGEMRWKLVFLMFG